VQREQCARGLGRLGHRGHTRCLPPSPRLPSHDACGLDGGSSTSSCGGSGILPTMLRRLARRTTPHTTHHREITNSATILRERHPLEGHSLQVISSMTRRGIPLLLVVLPNGSRSLIPTAWTDWLESKQSDGSSRVAKPEGDGRCLASIRDLLRMRIIVDALLGQCPIRQPEAAANKERPHAMDTGFSRDPARKATNSRSTRRRSTRRSSANPGTSDRAVLRSSDTDGVDR
jgi:hypothetical protein